MSVNRHLPHVFVLPEDDANRQLANGFLLDQSLSDQIRVLEEAGGWNQVIERFCTIYAVEMDRWQRRFMVLLIDFDKRSDRLAVAQARIPERLTNRVFILGSWSEPEELKQALGCSYEDVGLGMAQDCREGTYTTWGHELLRHNAAEINRLYEHVRPVLFPPI